MLIVGAIAVPPAGDFRHAVSEERERDCTVVRQSGGGG